MVVLSTRLGHAACCARREGLSGKILLAMSESAASVSTNAHFGSTSRSLRGGEVGEMHRGGSTKVCGCRMMIDNHCQLSISWWWPAGRLGCSPGDPRYFTHVGRVAVITRDGHARLPHHRIKHLP